MTKTNLTERIKSGMVSLRPAETIVTPRSGTFLVAPNGVPCSHVKRFVQQAKLIDALKPVAEGLAEHRIDRHTASKMLNEALGHLLPEEKGRPVPPTILHTAGFGYGALLERMAQDMAGTAPIAKHVLILNRLVERLDFEHGNMLLFATRAPDALTVGLDHPAHPNSNLAVNNKWFK